MNLVPGLILLMALSPVVVRSHTPDVLIPIPDRTDFIHDHRRDLADVSAGGEVIRHDLAAGSILPSISIGGSLTGLDLSPDGDTTAIGTANSSGSETHLTGDWRTIGGGPEHRGYFPGIVGSARFEHRWTSRPGVATHPVVVAEGRVYAVGTNGLSALSESTGIEVWSSDPGLASWLNAPSYADGNLYLQRRDGTSSQLCSVNASTGRTNWAVPMLNRWWTSDMPPTCSGDRIYVNGGELWGFFGFSNRGEQLFFEGVNELANWTPTVWDGRLFTHTGGRFREHHAATGDVLWSLSVGGNISTLVVDEGVALVNTGSSLVAVDLTRHQRMWETPGTFRWRPVTANGTVYTFLDNVVEALNLSDGRTKAWFVSPGEYPFYTQPIITDDVLVAPNNGTTVVLDRFNGSLRQSIPVAGDLALANQVLYVVGEDGAVHAYSVAADVQLNVEGTPAPVGSPEPLSYGTHRMATGTTLECTAPAEVESAGTRYDCLGWTGTGSVPAEGGSLRVDFEITTDSKLTWRWQAREHFLTTQASGRGSVSPGSAWWPAGASAEVRAAPEPGYRLIQWQGDVPEGSSGLTLTVPMDQPRRIVAIFGPETVVPVTGDWPMDGGGPAHTGYAPGHLGKERLQRRWSAPLDAGGRVNPLSVARGRVFATPFLNSSGMFVTALGAFNGHQIWKTSLPKGYSVTAPAYSDEGVFVQWMNLQYQSEMWKLDARSGAPRWNSSFPAGSLRFMAPTIAEGGVYVIGNGGFHRFDQFSGTQRFLFGDAVYWAPAYYDHRLFSFLSVLLYEHDLSSGELLWTLQFGETFRQPTTLRALAADEGRAFLCTDDNLVCVNLGTRMVEWRMDGPFSGTPTVANGVVYAIQQTNVLAFSLKGELLATYVTPDPLSQQPIVTDDTMMVSGDSAVHRFDLGDYHPRESLPVGGAISLANGQLFVAGVDNQVHAYGPGPGAILRVATQGVEAGDPEPVDYGDNVVTMGAEMEVSVESPWSPSPGTRYLATRYDLAGAVTGSGTNTNRVALVVNGDTTLTWTWTRQHLLNIGPSVGGRTDVAGGWYEAGQPVVLTAQADEYYSFDGWTGDGVADGNQLTVQMAGPREVSPRFKPDLFVKVVRERDVVAVELRWLVAPGQSYRVLRAPVVTGPFEEIAHGVHGAGPSWTTYTHPLEISAAGFFRIETE